ncbi:GxxExxY protein [Flavobacterium limicola]|uniref:GxxExxY protein n=1 Tax=Flavobacterium limicola TaxID=180441 RepID=UPI000EAE0B4D
MEKSGVKGFIKKALNFIIKLIYMQLTNYLKCTKMELGMLINFGTPSLPYKRMINLRNSN